MQRHTLFANSDHTLIMVIQQQKQPILKPQDLLIVLKLIGVAEAVPSYATLGRELYISASEVHAGVQRAITSHLLTNEHGALVVNRSALREFLIHGVKYSFPVIIGAITRGLPTGVSAHPLKEKFDQAEMLPIVWPDPEGDVRGASLCPLYPTAPKACKADVNLYRALVITDALRGGAAREREIATEALTGILQ